MTKYKLENVPLLTFVTTTKGFTVTKGFTQLLPRRVTAPIPHLNFCSRMSSASRHRQIILASNSIQRLREKHPRTYFALTSMFEPV